MGVNKGTGRLLLTPVDAAWAPPQPPLLKLLRGLDFIGAALAEETDGIARFLIGEAFLQQITFMGCSPHIELEPPADGSAFCHIGIIGPHATPQFMQGNNTQPPRCSGCRTRLDDWRDRTAEWSRAPLAADFTCPKCGIRQRPVDLQWRQNAAFGRLFIAVEDVFPGEAVPVPTLLKKLAGLGGDWHYCYVRG